MSNISSPQQIAQDKAYRFPYHYIPQWDGHRFSQIQYLSWGFQYLGGITAVLNCLQDIEFRSVVDIGCGDGRFLRELSARFPGRKMLGIDYSEAPIQLAKSLNPGMDFQCRNIIDDSTSQTFDVVTAIEVLEHIPPADASDFLNAISGLLAEHGVFILTVPHENHPVLKKHFQHFNSEKLKSLLDRNFCEIKLIPLDANTFSYRVLKRLCLGIERFYVITNKTITTSFFQWYLRNCLYAKSEDNCQRLAAVCRKKERSKI